MDLISKVLEYNPAGRLTPLQACAHGFFDELRNAATRLPSGRALPPLFDFTAHELSIEPTVNHMIIPGYAGNEAGTAAPGHPSDQRMSATGSLSNSPHPDPPVATNSGTDNSAPPSNPPTTE